MSIPLLHPFIVFLAYIINSQLVQEIDYLKVENRILRSKLGRSVTLTDDEHERLMKFGISLGPRLEAVHTIDKLAS